MSEDPPAGMIHVSLAIAFSMLFIASHVLCFRVGLMRYQISRLAWLGLAWLVVFGAVTVWVRGAVGAGAGTVAFLPLVLASVVVYALLCLCYVVECAGIELRSPSMQIVEMVRSHPRGRMSLDEFRWKLTNETLLAPRLAELITEGFVTFDGTRYRLTSRGLWTTRVFTAYRRLLRRGEGG